MKYYGIKTPEDAKTPSYIYWISTSESGCWQLFFNVGDKKHYMHGCMSDGMRAYKAIGYKCVELRVNEKELDEEEHTKAIRKNVSMINKMIKKMQKD